MKKISRSIYIIFLIMILGLILRLGMWYFSGQHLNPWSAFLGIVSRDIGKLNRPQMFFYGQPLIGSIGIYLEALILKFFKLNLFTNILSELIPSILFIFSSYLLGKEIFGRLGGFIAMTLSAIAPYNIIFSSFTPLANYQIILFLGNLIFLLMYKICYGNSKYLNKLLALLGFISGLALWSNFIALPYILIILVFLSIRFHGFLFSRKLFLLLAGFFIGGFPFLTHNIVKALSNIQKVPFGNILFNEIAKNIFQKIPDVLGTKPIWILILIYLVVFLYVIWISRLGLRNITKLTLAATNKLEILFFFCIIAIIIISRFKFHTMEGTNDLIVIYPVCVIFTAAFLLRVKEKSQLIFNALFSLVIVVNMANSILTAWNLAKNQLKQKYIFEEIVSCLKSQSVDFVAVSSITNKDEPSLCLQYEDSLKNTALIMQRDNFFNIVESLKSMGFDFDYSVVDDTLIFPSKLNCIGVEIPSAKWSAVSNFNSQETYKAWDRNISTRWTTHKTQVPGMFFKLDLGEEETVERLVINFNPDTYDYPRAFKIEFSKDGKEWECVADIPNTAMELFFSGEKPPFKNCEIKLSPKRTRFIKFTLTGITCDYYWSLRELRVLSPFNK